MLEASVLLWRLQQQQQQQQQQQLLQLQPMPQTMHQHQQLLTFPQAQQPSFQLVPMMLNPSTGSLQPIPVEMQQMLAAGQLPGVHGLGGQHFVQIVFAAVPMASNGSGVANVGMPMMQFPTADFSGAAPQQMGPGFATAPGYIGIPMAGALPSPSAAPVAGDVAERG